MEKEYIVLTPSNLSSGTASSGVIQLNERLDDEYELESFVCSYIPYVVITGNNDQFTVQTYGTLTLPQGVYDGPSMATQLGTSLSTLTGLTVTVTYSSVTGYFTFSNTMSTTLTFVFGGITNSAHRIIGFPKQTVTVLNNGTSTLPADFQPHDCMYFTILNEDQRIQGNNFCTSLYIPWQSSNGKIYIDRTNTTQRLTFRQFKMIQFAFVDGYGRVINLFNGWTMILKKAKKIKEINFYKNRDPDVVMI